MKKNSVCLLLAVLFSLLSARGQVLSYSNENDGVSFQLQNGTLKVYVCSGNSIRVSFSTSPVMPEKSSLIVTKSWGAPSYTVTEDQTTVVLKTNNLNVSVLKSNATVGFYTSGGELILQEFAKSMSAKTIYGISTHSCVATFNSPVDEAIYGLGQHQQSIMNYKGKTQVLEQANMEIALPVILTNKGYGLMWDNYSRTVFSGNLLSNTKYKFESDGGDMVDYYFFYGPDPDSVISAYRTATGTAPLFPKWSYGLFQSMDKYEKSGDLLDVAAKYRKNRIPVDCIVQDWDYWTPYAWGSHKMNPTKYPNPTLLLDSLHHMNLHAMISIWPIFTVGDANYNEMNGLNAIYPSSGTRHYYDPHNEQARTVYWRQVKENLFGKYGWDAWWADGDEPDNWPDTYDRKTANTALGKGVLYNNTYPLMHTSSVYQGWRNDMVGKRLFTLSRSAFAGQQRNAAASWSGDINSSWIDYKKQLSAGLNFSMSGIPYWTTDIGGYWGADWTTQENRELFTRWFQYGTFCPIFRIHGKLERTLYSETAWDAVTRKTLVKYDKLRYRLMPYIYSLAWKVTNENYTLMRHLVMDYRTDSKVKDISNQFLFGPFMMVNPIADKGVMSRPVYLPEGKWFDFWTGESLNGGVTITADAPLDKMPVFIKAGSILPMGPEIEYAGQKSDPLEIRLYGGADGSFSLYDDEGDTYAYEQGAHSLIPLSYKDSEKQLTIGNRQGSYPGMLQNRTFKIVWVEKGYGTGVESPLTTDTVVEYTGSEVKVKFNAEKTIFKTHYEAEEATFIGGLEVASSYKGYSGNGYVKGVDHSENAGVEFSVQVKEAGNYLLKLRYSAASTGTGAALALAVNDLALNNLKCDPTVSWNSWSEVSSIVYLNSGNNKIVYQANAAAVNLDCIDLTVPSEPASLVTNLKKITRIKLHNSLLYLEDKNGNPGYGVKDELNGNQIWVIEKTTNRLFKITSSVSNKCLTVKNASVENNESVVLEDYRGLPNQQWSIDDYGCDLSRILASHSGKSLEAASEGLIQKTDSDLFTQRWLLENPVSAGNGNGLLGEYYSGKAFNTFVFNRIDEKVNFNWGALAPVNSMPVNAFSIRWSGKVLPQFTAEYTFYTSSDDGVKLWVNDSLIISDWNARALTEKSGKIRLVANTLYTIRLDYFDNEYDAIVNLGWACPSLEREIIPKTQLFGELLTDIKTPSENDQSKLKVFPNPATVFTEVEFQLDNTSNAKIELFNMQGMLIKSKTVVGQTGLNGVRLNIEDLEHGLYLIKLTTGQTIESIKLCVE